MTALPKFETTTDLRLLVENILTHIWVEGRTDRIKDYYHEDAVIKGVIPDVDIGRAELAGAMSHLFMLIEIKSYDLWEFVTDGHAKVCYQVVFEIAHKPSGKTGQLRASIYAHVKDGQFIASSSVMDYLKLLEQLEVVPPGTLLIGLSGQTLS